MDMTGATTATAPPDSDGETPPRPTTNKPMGFLAYANGTHALHLKHCITTNTKSQPPAPAPPASSYRECMRNHAAGIGGHALDGCCEFMPSPLFSASDPTSLRCAACGCHRNFHRRHPLDPNSPPPPAALLPLPPPPPADSPSSLPSPPQMAVSLRRGWAASGSGGGRSSSSGAGKKRFRTKFSRQQKERMYDLAGRFGWKMQKMDKAVVEEFCTEIGVGKEVLKVWLHNNKNTPLPTNNDGAEGNDPTLHGASTHNNGGGGAGASSHRLHFQPVHASSSSSGASLS